MPPLESEPRRTEIEHDLFNVIFDLSVNGPVNLQRDLSRLRMKHGEVSTSKVTEIEWRDSEPIDLSKDLDYLKAQGFYKVVHGETTKTIPGNIRTANIFEPGWYNDIRTVNERKNKEQARPSRKHPSVGRLCLPLRSGSNSGNDLTVGECDDGEPWVVGMAGSTRKRRGSVSKNARGKPLKRARCEVMNSKSHMALMSSGARCQYFPPQSNVYDESLFVVDRNKVGASLFKHYPIRADLTSYSVWSSLLSLWGSDATLQSASSITLGGT
jgi:hypothetical protein